MIADNSNLQPTAFLRCRDNLHIESRYAFQFSSASSISMTITSNAESRLTSHAQTRSERSGLGE